MNSQFIHLLQSMLGVIVTLTAMPQSRGRRAARVRSTVGKWLATPLRQLQTVILSAWVTAVRLSTVMPPQHRRYGIVVRPARYDAHGVIMRATSLHGIGAAKTV
jgi:hypothetical protein